jgi:colanic acid/amylovoran biosynthesis glycosyltransferase
MTRPLRLAYYVNQYPKVSHTFIRREILALEQRGVPVLRFAARCMPGELVDPEDIAELSRTRALLDAGPLAFAAAAAWALLTRPLRLASALASAWQMGRRAGNGRLRHLVYLAEACLLARWLHQAGATHLHAHFGTNSAAVALLSHQLGGPPYSMTVHGPEEFDMPAALSLDTKLQHASFVIAISSFCRSQLLRWSSEREWPKVRQVRCALARSYFDRPAVPVPAAPRFVCVGRLSAEKGQLLLLEALRRVLDLGVSGPHLTLAGEGPARGALEQSIERLGLQPHVTITGWVDNRRVAELLEQSRALVLPSFAEGLPVVIMEAFALRRPVISTYVAGIPELVETGLSGWLVPAGDVDALAEALQAACTSPTAKLEAMGQAGHQRARARHNVEEEAARLHAHFLAAGA